MFKMKQVAAHLLFVTSLILGVSIFLPSGVLATSTAPDIMGQLNAGSQAAGYGTEAQDIRITVAKGIQLVLSLLGIVFVVLVVYAGFLIFTAAGNEENVSKAKKIISYAVIGLIIILSAYSITSFVTSRIIAETAGQQ
ncbi:MAG TPA: hypothetical protein PK295_02335 [Candidatus Magasanikbacteria bacterium]|nr:hypothetical protein [Candidatus Magasanikbacteria bacterium]